MSAGSRWVIKCAVIINNSARVAVTQILQLIYHEHRELIHISRYLNQGPANHLNKSVQDSFSSSLLCGVDVRNTVDGSEQGCKSAQIISRYGFHLNAIIGFYKISISSPSSGRGLVTAHFSLHIWILASPRPYPELREEKSSYTDICIRDESLSELLIGQANES